MLYIAIFGFTYILVAIAVFAMLSGRTVRFEADMLNQGMSRKSVDSFYRSMQRQTVLATLRATAITSTALAGMITLVVWLLK
ncbi:hypothetical protein [Algiphilus aromaticivorans]|uniref:hypothetical protein n=1 Tax=Algiphilus aromaticivorans TaxID=382454 RepID=UPI0005C1BCDD|nr:hypothetical protein [Algiphilus aromaticivorans]